MATGQVLTEIDVLGVKKKAVTFNDDVKVLEFDRVPKVQLTWWEEKLAKSGIFFKHRPAVPITSDITFESVFARQEAELEAKRQEKLEIAKIKEEFEELWKIRERDIQQIKENGPSDDLGQSDDEIKEPAVPKKVPQKQPKRKIEKSRRKIAFDANQEDSENEIEICMIPEVSKCVQSDEGFMSEEENTTKHADNVSVPDNNVQVPDNNIQLPDNNIQLPDNNVQSSSAPGLQGILKNSCKQLQSHVPIVVEEEPKFPKDKTYAQIMRDRRGPKFKPDLSILNIRLPLREKSFDYMSHYWMYSSDEEEEKKKKEEEEKQKQKKKKKQKEKQPQTVATPKFEIFVESDSLMEENREADNLRKQQEELDKLTKEKLEMDKKKEKRQIKKEFKKTYVKVSERVNPRFMMPPFDRPLSQCFDMYLKRDHIGSNPIDFKKKNAVKMYVPDLIPHPPMFEYTLGSFGNSVPYPPVENSVNPPVMSTTENSTNNEASITNESTIPSIAQNDQQSSSLNDSCYNSREGLSSSNIKESPAQNDDKHNDEADCDSNSSKLTEVKQIEENQQPLDLSMRKKAVNEIKLDEKETPDVEQKGSLDDSYFIPRKNLRLNLKEPSKQNIAKRKDETDCYFITPKRANDDNDEQPLDLTMKKGAMKEIVAILDEKEVPVDAKQKDSPGINHISRKKQNLKEPPKLATAVPVVKKAVKRKIETEFDLSLPKRTKDVREQSPDLALKKTPVIVKQKAQDSNSYDKFCNGFYSPIPKEPLKVQNIISEVRTAVKRKIDTECDSSPPKRAKENLNDVNESPPDLGTNKKLVVQQKVPLPLSVYEKESNIGINHKGNVKMIGLTLMFDSAIDVKVSVAVGVDPINSQSLHETSHMRAYRFPELTVQQIAEHLTSGTHGLCLVPLHQ